MVSAAHGKPRTPCRQYQDRHIWSVPRSLFEYSWLSINILNNLQHEAEHMTPRSCEYTATIKVRRGFKKKLGGQKLALLPSTPTVSMSHQPMRVTETTLMMRDCGWSLRHLGASPASAHCNDSRDDTRSFRYTSPLNHPHEQPSGIVE